MFSYGSDNMPPPDMHGQPLEMVKQINRLYCPRIRIFFQMLVIQTI